MKNEIQNLVNAIVEDYRDWTYKCRYVKDNPEYCAKLVEEFANGIVVKEGPKYTKIYKDNGGCIWGFVVAVDTDNKFRKGDILMAAGYAAPARNAARGNILDNNFDINWTGPKYL